MALGTLDLRGPPGGTLALAEPGPGGAAWGGQLDLRDAPDGVLAFGTAPSGGGDADALLAIDADIGALDAELLLAPGHPLALDGDIGALDADLALLWDANVSRGPRHFAASAWQDGACARAAVAHRWQQGAPMLLAAAHVWQDAAARSRAVAHTWQEPTHPRNTLASAWQDATAVRRAAATRWEEPAHLRNTLAGAWQDAAAVRRATATQWQELTRVRHARAARWQDATALRRLVVEDGRDGTPVRGLWRTHWQDARHLPPGRSWHTPPAPEPPPLCYTPEDLGKLQFGLDPDLPLGALAFWCHAGGSGPNPVASVVVPIQRVYMTLNSIALHRVDTGAVLPALAFSMSLDVDSWTWSWSASLHKDAAAHLGRDAGGDPAQLLAEVNGVPFRLRLERIARDRRFLPQERWAVSGRGLAAVLSEPWAPTMSFASSEPLTAQQLALDALTINGVGIGWDIDWQLQDWPVPAGAWALQGSYIDAVNDIARAAGGYVQPHATAQTLRILPRYPAAPWDWGDVVPDFEIPAAAAEIEGTEFLDKPAYNKVFVGGIAAGVFGPITRAGTAGDLVAPQATHALITDAAAHRQRGLAELADTGRQARVTLSMQVLPETGVIVPGAFVRYVGPETVLGIVRATAIEWSAPRLRQQLEIETHV